VKLYDDERDEGINMDMEEWVAADMAQQAPVDRAVEG